MKIYDRQGDPISHATWLRLTLDPSYVRVATTKIVSATNPATVHSVSTAWVGHNPRHIGTGPPLVFETMVFTETADSNKAATLVARYATEEQAREHHLLAVQEIVDAVQDPTVSEVPLPTSPEDNGEPISDAELDRLLNLWWQEEPDNAEEIRQVESLRRILGTETGDTGTSA